MTASHNPPSDNGFKCYGRSGGQVIPPDDAGIIACVDAASDREIPEKPFDLALADGSIRWVDDDVDRGVHRRGRERVGLPCARHFHRLHAAARRGRDVGRQGARRPRAFAGFTSSHPSARRTAISPTCRTTSPTPSIPELSKQRSPMPGREGPTSSSPAIPTPIASASRFLSSRDPQGDWTTLDGNQIGVMLAAFVIKESEALGQLRSDHYLVSTLVSTPMTRALAEREGVRLEDDLLVGFKWIAHRIDQAGHASFLFALRGIARLLERRSCPRQGRRRGALLFAELAAAVKDRKQTVLEYLDDLYIDVGHHGDRPINKTYPGREGLAKIQTLMEALRESPPRRIGGLVVTDVYDYKTHEVRALNRTEPARPLPQPDSDLLIFHTERPGTRFAARPSGTEPKIKFYLFARTPVSGPDHLAAAKAETKATPRPDGRRSRNLSRSGR